MTIRIGIGGVGGRMGRALIESAMDNPRLTPAAGLVRPGSALCGTDLGVLVGRGPCGVLATDAIDAALAVTDVFVDFSLPEGFQRHLAACQAHGVPMVVGVTGLDTAQMQAMAGAAEHIGIVHAANFSVGVNLALQLVSLAASVYTDTVDVEIVEAHHRQKIDAPSGTALALGQRVAQTLGRSLEEEAVYGRQGRTGARKRSTIGFSTIRGGDVVGEHTVLFLGTGERLEISHRASDRATFARGALRAAEWLSGGMGPGLYGMEDVLGFAPAGG